MQHHLRKPSLSQFWCQIIHSAEVIYQIFCKSISRSSKLCLFLYILIEVVDFDPAATSGIKAVALCWYGEEWKCCPNLFGLTGQTLPSDKKIFQTIFYQQQIDLTAHFLDNQNPIFSKNKNKKIIQLDRAPPNGIGIRS